MIFVEKSPEKTGKSFEKTYNVKITKVLEEDFFERKKHVLSHLIWNLRCHLVEAKEIGPLGDMVQFVTLKRN